MRKLKSCFLPSFIGNLIERDSGMSRGPYKSNIKSQFHEEGVENKLGNGVRRIMKATYGLKRIG